ncbi:MAG TPA: hypothetical protein VLX59_05860, partial [Acidimicrobiales bacterium]|nr:hypothetical protein [Acidimicrobiales bacterium]
QGEQRAVLVVQVDPVLTPVVAARRTRSPGRTAGGTCASPAHVGTDHPDRVPLTVWSNATAAHDRYHR